jgi:hypothetical protein
MPSWKKLITSGSAASLSSITTSGDITIPVTNKLYLDGGVDTYIQETSADLVDLYVGGQNALRVLESSDVSYAYVPDSQFLGAGTSIDFTMNHDGSNSQLTNNTGDLYIRNNDNDKDIIFQTDDGSGGITAYLTLDGSATDIKIAQHMQFADNKELRIGNDNDLRLVSNNSNTFIDNYLGSMFIRQTVDDQDIIFQCDNGSGGLATYLTLDGSTGHLNLTPPNNVGIGTDSPQTKLHVVGTISGSQIESSGDVIAYSTSDRKFKDNIEPIQDSLYKVSQIGGYTFDWNDKQETYKGSDVGVIAQEIQEVLPEVVTERENGLAVKYEKIVPLLIESIKELKQEIDDIKQKCDCLNK